MTGSLQERFTFAMDNEFVRKAITVKPDPVSTLADAEPFMAATILADALKQSFIPNQFSLDFIHEMVGRAFTHHCYVFPNEAEHQAKIYNPPITEGVPICLTGLAGLGKSRTIDALKKVMPVPSEYHSPYFGGALTLESYWYASAEGKESGKSLLLWFLFGGSDRKSGNFDRLLLECRRRAYRDIVSLLLLDETQHISLGLGTSRIVTILLTLMRIGPPAVFVSNFSLGHKLFKRNNEDKQRLLPEPRIMLPDEVGSEDWKAYANECVRVCGGHIRTRGRDFAAELHRYTFGIKRIAVHLLKQAYIESRKSGRAWIEMDDLGSAFRSAEFSANAGDVQALNNLALGERRLQKARPDLWCPFDLPTAYTSSVAQSAIAERDRQAAETIFDSALNAVERAAKAQIVQPSDKRPSKSSRRPPAAKLSEEEQKKLYFEYECRGQKPAKQQTR
ncbi:transposase [Pseudomonas asiatica]|uniref:transposase n=1 Tax=Pseudomonas asiatica TaxID=2219225 RepID=UPI0015FDDD91|nr:transposase [Pseudomonas asiatica]MBA6112386.1 transposase [Pseudomonas asiatica]